MSESSELLEFNGVWQALKDGKVVKNVFILRGRRHTSYYVALCIYDYVKVVEVCGAIPDEPLESVNDLVVHLTEAISPYALSGRFFALEKEDLLDDMVKDGLKI